MGTAGRCPCLSCRGTRVAEVGSALWPVFPLDRRTPPGATYEIALLAAPAHLVARVDRVGALSPTRVPGHAVRTYSGRPSSSMRFSTLAAIATSVACRPFVCE